MRLVPRVMEQQIDLEGRFVEWTDGFPGILGSPLPSQVERMNGLPVTPFTAETLTRYLAEPQARGIQQRFAA